MARTLIIAVAGVAVTGLAITGWRALSSPPPPPPPQVAAAQVVRHVPMVNLLTAEHDIAPGAFLRSSDISSVPVIADAASPKAWRDTPADRAALMGALVRRAISHDALLDPSELLLAGEHGFLAALLTPGMRGFTITHDQIVSGSELIWPGDRIDLILTQQMPPSTPLGHQISAETVLTDLRILAVDRKLVHAPPSDEKDTSRADGNSGTVTVEVSSADAEKLAIAIRLGKVAFAVRSALGVTEKLVAETSAAPGANAIWADGVMHSLDQVPSPPPAASIHVFDGTGDKEYKF